MRARADIPVGKRYGNLVVESNQEKVMCSDGKARWGCLLKCDCGKSTTMLNRSINARPPKYCARNCGLRWASNNKGIGSTSLPGWYRSYNAMKQRCLDENCKDYDNYGGRGIKICDRWLENPMNFYKDMGDRPENMTIDRIIVDGDYEPDNCKWATAITQAQNKRVHHRNHAKSALGGQ